MYDNKENKHENLLKTSIFKGREDLYYVFLKSEKISLVLHLIQSRAPQEVVPRLNFLCEEAESFTTMIPRLAVGELATHVVATRLLTLLVRLRSLSQAQILNASTVELIVSEYERLLEHLGLYDWAQDVALLSRALEVPAPASALPTLSIPQLFSPNQSSKGQSIKDKEKGHPTSNSDQDRTQTVLEIIRKKGRVSIKDISAVVRDCSEKTIQRALGSLIQSGNIRRIGERRWSYYEVSVDA